jgi:crossover junction endodeoxyribonuclease RusA
MMIAPGAFVVIALRWPPPILFPNARNASHWRQVRGPKAEYRDECYWLAKQAIGRVRFPVRPNIAVRFVPPDARKRDDDGMIGAFKNARDAIAAAIGFDDEGWFPSYHFARPEKPGAIWVTLTAVGASNAP